ncbi:MAG TPA: MBL fold metallo-hydrolase [Syntrophales bacterium]|nr:MBL fold metallo-hydrolase [Syntrophales bacterium]
MLKLKQNIYSVPGEGNGQFPFCNGLYLEGREKRVLIDAGMGKQKIQTCLQKGVDILILSHCHYDHRSSIRLMQDVPLWCHKEEAPYLESRERFFEGMGFARSGIGWKELQMDRLPVMPVSKLLADGDCFDLGGVTLEIVHAPGHTPGHLAFRVNGDAVLFTSDVALTPFGPFYGNDFGDVDQFIASIKCLGAMKAGCIATSHAGPFFGDAADRFKAYEKAIHEKDSTLLKMLGKPLKLEDLTNHNLFYPVYHEPSKLLRWFERVEIEKHLERLTRAGKVRTEGDFFIRAE